MDLIIDIIKLFTLTTVSYLFFNKIKALEFAFWKKILFGAGFVVLTSTTFLVLNYFIGEPFKTVIVIFFTSIFLALLLRERIEVMFTSFVIAYASSYVLYLIATIFSAAVMYPLRVSDDSIYHYIIPGVISIGIAFLLLKINVDVSSIHKKFASGIFLSISSIVIIMYGLFKEDISDESTTSVIAGFVALGYGIYSCLRRETTISKDENDKDIINKKQQDILAQKEKDIAVLTNMHDYLASVVHKDDKKLDAMQRAVEKLVMRSEQTEVLEDAHNILNEISISRDKAEKDFNKKIFDGKSLPLTGLQIVDAKFETVSERAMLKSIDFDLAVNGDVSGFDQIIPQFDLANIIGDLTENSFTAIKHLDKDLTCHKVQFSIGITDNSYELSISDSGIPFNIDILIKLGVARVTSHPDDGGSGYGYETIFELLNEYGASLIITEYKPVPYAYSKNIAILFDGKADFIIKSFRADAIRKQNANTNLTIQNFKG